MHIQVVIQLCYRSSNIIHDRTSNSHAIAPNWPMHDLGNRFVEHRLRLPIGFGTWHWHGSIHQHQPLPDLWCIRSRANWVHCSSCCASKVPERRDDKLYMISLFIVPVFKNYFRDADWSRDYYVFAINI